MSSPLGLTIKTSLDTMLVGDCIPCRYTATTSGVAGFFSELGTCIANEIPITGSATPDGLFYFIKTAKGTLIADRVIQTNISWDVLNTSRFIEGKPLQEIPKMISEVLPLGRIFYSGQTYPAYKAFDLDISTYWYFSNALPKYIGYEFLNPIIAKAYAITSASGGNQDGSPTTWTFEGSNNILNDTDDWMVLDTKTSQATWATSERRLFSIPNNTSYKKYRIYITNSQSGTINASIAQLEIYSNKIIRSLSGGCAYTDANGNMSLTDKSLGAFPTNNEWDKYIVNNTLNGKITKDNNTVWNHKTTIQNWCRETPINGIWVNTSGSTTASNISRMLRGYRNDGWNNVNWTTSNSAYNLGFRPVLNYVETNIINEVIY